MRFKITWLFLLIGCSVFSQVREEWKGQIVRDTLIVESIVIYNMNTNKGIVTDADGFFKLVAAVGDTLVFSGLAIKQKKVLLTDELRKSQPIQVKLQSFINELDMVQVSSKNNQAVFKGSSQKIVDQKYFDDQSSSPKNPFIYDGSMPNGTNFVRLYKDVVKLIRKSRGKKSETIAPIDFSETVVSKFDYSFFTKTLELDASVIKLFLVFCEEDEKVQTFTVQTSKFELMDFLITKSTEFKRLATIGK